MPYSFETKTSLQEIADSAKEFALYMLSRGQAREKILNHLVEVAERISGPGSTCSILRIDEEGLLRNAASPGLPSDYLAAIDKLKPDAKVGTCAAAAATGKVVITPSFTDDEKWAELKQLPMGLGYLSAWSVPIKSSTDVVLGTFGTYFRRHRSPTPREREGIEMLSLIAAMVLAK